MGSVVNFDLTPWLYRTFRDHVSEKYALGLTLWLGASLIFISILVSPLASYKYWPFSLTDIVCDVCDHEHAI